MDWITAPPEVAVTLQPSAAGLLDELEAAWKALNASPYSPNYVLVRNDLTLPRRVYRWRGRKHVCGARRLSADNWVMLTVGVPA